MHKNTIVGIIIVVLVIGAGAFYGGMKYKASKIPPGFSRPGLSANPINAGRQLGGQRNGGFTSGEIITQDDQSITVKLSNGGSKIIFLSNATEILKSVSGTMDDLKVGQAISVNGTANSDGSITAQSIQLRPQPPKVP